MTYQQNQTAKARAWANAVLATNPEWRDPDKEAAAQELQRLLEMEKRVRDAAVPDWLRELAGGGCESARRLLEEW